MRVLLLDDNKINKLSLPDQFEGFFGMYDDDNNVVINIEGTEVGWKISQNFDTSIYEDGNFVPDTIIKPYKFYDLVNLNETYLLYAESSVDNMFGYYSVSNNSKIIISNTSNATIRYSNKRFTSNIELDFINEEWTIKCDKPEEVYINGFRLKNNELRLNFGDSIFIFGLRINLIYGMITINNPINQVAISDTLCPASLKIYGSSKEIPTSDIIKEANLYSDNDYFFKTPRVRRFVEHYILQITPPPAPEKKSENSAILTLGPTITMAITSIVSAYSSINNIFSKKETLADNIPQLIIAVASLITALVWPNLSKIYTKKLNAKKEQERQTKYNAYLKRKAKMLANVQAEQKSILVENLITPKECETMILSKLRTLWERSADQKDFLTVRVGTGVVDVDMEGGISEEDFSLESDELKDKVIDLINTYRTIDNCPMGYSFNNKNITAIMCGVKFAKPFIENVLIQILSFHSYDDVKLVFMVDKHNMETWSQFKEFPHLFSNDKQVRFFATDTESYKYLDTYLTNIINQRMISKDEQIENETGEEKDKVVLPYYLIITDNYPGIRKLNSINKILNNKNSIGMGIICLENRLYRLPSQCENFLLVDSSSSILCTNINNYKATNFVQEVDNSINIPKCSKILGNIPIEFSFENKSLPETLGFLEMFNVGRVEQLNTLNRWRINDPVTSLKSQIGIDDEGHPIYLDLHEKYHGPHGLIAGTTGSGKSEFIITYILSLVVNYSPNEVSFILIDYKGGGLAGAFENKTLGLKLPHLAGTITNLDKASLNRTLVSITSELERRQKKFNKVREELGETTIDIYKYQRLFREGKIKEPMPHLFIISDEFAELKSQQPEFMDDLISTARIGRSLGIHLILATQKPSGVVNDQIWSNSKFKVCLKVQDASDSYEVLKKPDASTITNAGRFYLQVGNNEIFMLGQSGWSGTKYIGTESIKRNYDRSINFIDDVGKVIKNDDGVDRTVKIDTSKGDELGNVLKYVCAIAEKEHIRTSDLWLPEIDANIFVDDLAKKYNYESKGISALVGEIDAPSKQVQDKLVINFENTGNTAIYGITGSNREMLLGTMLYSLCMNYSPDDLNIYIADFGSEVLRMYSKFPQVGDIVFNGEDDKLKKLIQFILNCLSERKELFSDYNGDYKLYNRKSGNKVPVIMFVLNNYDSFKETYSSYEDTFITLSRECERYGIMFIVSAAMDTSFNSKIRRNIHNILVLDMKDRLDYMDILGKIGGIYPASYPGRGMIFRDMAYEFQTAQVCISDELLDFVKTKASEQCAKYPKRALNIPVLPDIISNELFDPYIKDIKKLPIGIYRDNLRVSYYNFFKDHATIVSARNLDYTIDFIKTIIYEVKKLNQMVVLIDGEKKLNDLGGTVNGYVDQSFEPFILQFEQFLDTKIDGKNFNLILIIAGVDKFREEMSEKKFKGFFRGIRTFNNVRLLLVDSAKNFKKFGFDDWIKDSTNNNNGIWIGPGFGEQNVINVSTIDSSTRVKISKQFAWIVMDGEPKIAKIAGEAEKEDEE